MPERGLAINVSSSTLNAAIRGFVTAGSDGIVQMSQGGAELATGTQMIQPLGIDELGRGERSHYLLSAPLGHAHGRYQGGNVALRPSVLGEIQRAVAARRDERAAFDFVSHGGTGSTPDEIAEAASYGVVKMNLDSDTQYAYTRAFADHMFVNHVGVVRADCDIADKRAYDPRGWGGNAEQAMAARVVGACRQLGSAGRSLTRR